MVLNILKNMFQFFDSVKSFISKRAGAGVCIKIVFGALISCLVFWGLYEYFSSMDLTVHAYTPQNPEQERYLAEMERRRKAENLNQSPVYGWIIWLIMFLSIFFI